MNGFGYLGKARQTKKQAAAAKNRPIASWGTDRLKKFVAAGTGKDWQLKNAGIALRARGVTVKQAGVPQAPPPVADDRPTVGQWTADGTRYWNGTAWVLPGTLPPAVPELPPYVPPVDTTPGTTYNGNSGGGGSSSGWSGGTDWSGGGDAWGDLYGSGGSSSFAPRSASGASSGATNADGTPSSGMSGKTIAVLAAVGIGAYLLMRKKRGGK